MQILQSSAGWDRAVDRLKNKPARNAARFFYRKQDEQKCNVGNIGVFDEKFEEAVIEHDHDEERRYADEEIHALALHIVEVELLNVIAHGSLIPIEG